MMLFCGPAVIAQQGAQVQAIRDCLIPMVSQAAADPNAGGWLWETNGNGGYVLRMMMDVTGDGRAEAFVSSTLTSSGHSTQWAVFEVAEDGATSRYDKLLEFPSDSVWPDNGDGTAALIYQAPPDSESQRALPQEEWKHPVFRFTFAFPKIEQTLKDVTAAEAEGLRPSDPGKLPKVESILLADFLNDPQARWATDAEWIMDANGCFFRAGERDRVMKNVTFTPQAALVRLGIDPASIQPVSGTAAGPGTPGRSTPETESAMAQQTLDTASLETLWPVIIVVSMAAIGLLWLLLKKRK